MIIISVVGTTQSGSTLLFNLCRFMCEELKKTFDSCWIREFKKGNYKKDVDYLIVKAHGYDDSLRKRSDYIFLPVRDVRDCAISAFNRGFIQRDIKNMIAHMEKNVMFYERWKQYSTCIFRYESYMTNKDSTLRFLLDEIDVKLNNEQVTNILKKSDNMLKDKSIVKKDNHKDAKYKKTLMSQSHNTSGGQIKKWMKFYFPAERQKIKNNTKVVKFLKSFQYL